MHRRLWVELALAGLAACGGGNTQGEPQDATSPPDDGQPADAAGEADRNTTSADAVSGTPTDAEPSGSDVAAQVDDAGDAAGNTTTDAADANSTGTDAAHATIDDASAPSDSGQLNGGDGALESGVVSDAGLLEASASDGSGRDSSDSASDSSAVDATGSDAPIDDCQPVPACAASLWTEVVGGTGDATISTCGLHLQSTATVRVEEETSALPDGLDGDFTLVVQFADFSANQVGSAFADADFALENNDAILSAAISNGGYIIASVEPPGQSSPTDQTLATMGHSGTITFTRSGSVGSVTVESAGVTAFESGTIGAKRIYPHFDASSANGSVSVTIRDVGVSAGTGTFKTDTFTCNGL